MRGSPESGPGGRGARSCGRGEERWEELAPGRLKPARGQGSRVGTDSQPPDLVGMVALKGRS